MGLLPAAYEGPAWGSPARTVFDGRRGHELYNRYLDEIVRAEPLSFEGVCQRAPLRRLRQHVVAEYAMIDCSPAGG
jgi:hypothetical protein